MVWHGIIGMVWYGMVWYGMVWYGMVWYGMVWYGMVWYGMVWYGMVWYGMVWYGMAWYDMVCDHYLRLSLADRLGFFEKLSQLTLTGGHVILYPLVRICEMAELQFFSSVFLH